MPSNAIDLAAVEKVLADFPDPESGRSVLAMGQVRDLALKDGRLSFTLELTTHAAPLWKETKQVLESTLREKLPALAEVKIEMAKHRRPAEKLGQIGLAAKSVIAVGSGKGGVGKSTIAASIAFGLQRAGAVVGLMDADVYGPSIPHLLGVGERKPALAESKLVPIEAAGLRVMSMGFLIPPDQAVVWRGPMLHGAISKFLRDTDWGELDYLVIDLPPGTGDIALSLSQLLPLTGAVVVCTPQDVALLDATKAVAMFRQVQIPVLGIVENMSYFECPDCGKRYDIFGSGGAKRRAEELGVPFLGEVPIQIGIRARGDAGTTAANLEDAASAPYLEAICQNLARGLAARRVKEPPLPSLSVL